MKMDWSFLLTLLVCFFLFGGWLDCDLKLILQLVFLIYWKDFWQWKTKRLSDKTEERYVKMGIASDGIGLYCKGILLIQLLSLVVLGLIYLLNGSGSLVDGGYAVGLALAIMVWTRRVSRRYPEHEDSI